MEGCYKGRAWVFGDNINTDIISPPQYMELSIEKAAPYCMSAVRAEFAGNVLPGDILVAGNNLGSGSSRETSPLTLKYLGIRIIVAKSYARIFYRNCMNLGIFALCCKEAEKIEDGEKLEIYPSEGKIVCSQRNIEIQCDSIPENLLNLVEVGGLLPYLASKYCHGVSSK